MRKPDIEACFNNLFFIYKSVFYLNNPVGARQVKSKEDFLRTKNKWENMGMGCN